MGSGHKDLRPLGGVFHFQDIYFDTLGGTEYLALHLLIFHEHGICFAQIDADVSAVIPLHDTGHHVALFSIVLIEQCFSLFLADLLQDHVLGILSGDPAKLLGLDLHVHNVAHLIAGIHHLCLLQRDLLCRILYLFYNGLLRIYCKITGLAVDVHMDVVSLAEMVLTGCQQGILNGLQKGVLADIFFFFQYIQSFNQFFVHDIYPPVSSLFLIVLIFTQKFSRAIRKTASSMLSAALQLIFAHFPALRSCLHSLSSPCKHGRCSSFVMTELLLKIKCQPNQRDVCPRECLLFFCIGHDGDGICIPGF